MAEYRCGHGKTMREHCMACEKLWGIDDRRRSRESKMREALLNARSLLSPHVGDDAVMKICMEQINAALNL